MAKDPAALFYIDKWLVATKEMQADCRGWYLNLVLHQFDKGDLPDDIEELANLADVRISEYTRFKQVFEQVLKQRFEQNNNGRLENVYAREIMKAREAFKEKRSEAGQMSYFVKYVRKHLTQDENLILFLKKNVDLSKLDVKNEQMIKQVFKQISELYINVNKNVIVNNNTITEGGTGEIDVYPRFLVGDERVQEIKKYLDANYKILMTDLKLKYGELIFDSAIEEFEKRNLQKQWKDSQDLRSHFTNFLIKYDTTKRYNQKRDDRARKGLASTGQVNTGKGMGEL